MSNQSRAVTLLFNPFYYLAGGRALCLGLVAILLAALVGSWGQAHFDGVIDAHLGAAAPLWLFVVEGLLDWLCLAITIWLAGKIFSKTAFRTLDVLGTQALARWPTLLISLVLLPKAFQRFAGVLAKQLKEGRFQFFTRDGVVFLIVVLVMIPLLCWTAGLMYRSFSVSCNVKGGKAIGIFIAALVVAEIASKLCLAPVVRIAAGAQEPSPHPNNPPPSLGAGGEGDVGAAGGRFVDLLAKGDFARAVADFDDPMKQALPEAKLRTDWQALEKKAGLFQKQLGTRTEEQQGYHIALVTCQFEHTNLDTKVVFDSKGQIAGLFFQRVPTAVPANPATN